jgi:hypothetical protein
MDVVDATQLETKQRKGEQLSVRANIIPFSARHQVIRIPLGELSESLSLILTSTSLNGAVSYA